MSETGLSPAEQDHIQQAADQAYRVLTGEEDQTPRKDRWLDVVSRATVKAPLQSLVVALLLGMWVARRQ